MVKKIIGIGSVVLLVGALIGGGAYLLLRDANGASGGGQRGGQNRAATTGAGGGRWNGATDGLAAGAGGGRWNGATDGLTAGAGGGRWNGATDGLTAGTGGGRWNSGGSTLSAVERGGRGATGSAPLAGGGYRGGNAAAGDGAGTPAAAVAPADWVTVTGVVTAMEQDLVVRTADGAEVTFSLGAARYRDASGVAIAVGDEVQVTGFYEDGALLARTVTNLASGQVLALRDESGRPLWSGRGRRGQ